MSRNSEFKTTLRYESEHKKALKNIPGTSGNEQILYAILSYQPHVNEIKELTKVNAKLIKEVESHQRMIASLIDVKEIEADISFHNKRSERASKKLMTVKAKLDELRSKGILNA